MAESAALGEATALNAPESLCGVGGAWRGGLCYAAANPDCRSTGFFWVKERWALRHSPIGRRGVVFNMDA